MFILICLNYSQKDTQYSSVALGNEAIIGRINKSTLTALCFQSWIPLPWLGNYVFYTAQEAPQKSNWEDLLLLQMPKLSLKWRASFRNALAGSAWELEAAQQHQCSTSAGFIYIASHSVTSAEAVGAEFAGTGVAKAVSWEEAFS